MKALFIGAVFTFLFYFFTVSSFAATLSIDNSPSTIDESQEFESNVNLICSGCSDSYIRGVFYPSGSSYFGYTQDNSGNWSNASGSNCTSFYKISQAELQGGSWSGTLKLKPDPESSYYNGPGEYSFKIGRYTSSCSSSSVTWSQEKTMAITGPTPTPTPSNTPTPTNSPSSTNTPTSTKTPTPTKSPTPTKKPSPAKNPTVKETQDQSTLGITSENETPTKEPIKVASASKENIAGNIFILLGIVFAFLCAIVIFWPKIKVVIDKDAQDSNPDS